MTEIKHGTYSTYVNKKCRCDDCRVAAREYQQERTARLRGPDYVPKPRGRVRGEIQHGTTSGYTNRGCRCDLCREAINQYVQGRRKLEVAADDPRHGTANGYTNLGCRCDPCRAAINEYSKASGAGRRAALKFNYGMTPEQWDEMFEAQGGVCASCGTAPKETAKRRFHVDHDHDTGAVRAILCHGCNVALGQLGENAERIRALADYIEGFKPF